MILLVVRHQLSYDSFHQHSDRIYRVVQKVSWGSGDVWTGSSALMGPNLQKDFTEIERMARIHLRSVLVSYEGAKAPVRFQEERFGFADPAFFEIFAFSFTQGDPRMALAEPQSVVLTKAMAEKYFGKENPVGKTLRLDNQLDLQITGVLENVPSNSHLEFDFVAAFPCLNRLMNVPEFTSWWWPDVYTYVRVAEAAPVGRLNSEHLPAFIKRYREPDIAAAVVPQLQPVTDIHLYGATGNDGSIRYVYIFSAIAAFVLLIACINFMNLATARSIQRSREVGIRKVIGASRKQLVKQFLGESFFITLIAMLAGLALAELFLRVVNQMTGLSIVMNFGNAWLPIGMVGITIVVGLLSGSYPALFLSRFMPVRVLKGNTRMVAGGNRLRQGLVVFQFIISIVLIVGTLVVFKQLDFLRNKSLGFDKEQVVALPVHRDEVVQTGYGAFKNELLRSPGVVSVAATNSLPGAGRGEFMPAEIEGLTEKIGWTGRVLFVDYDFLQTMGIQLVEGRDFSLNFPTDAEQAFILNETNMQGIRSEALKLGIPLQQPITQNMRISYGEFGRVAFEKRGKIIGVTKDFHVTNPRFPITTAILTIAGEGMQNRFSHFLVRVSPDRPRETLKLIEEVWNKHFSHRPFELVF
ncbi:MAG: ABC transporter permease, partial [bacterium]